MATIFRSDNCAYTKVPSLIRSAKAYTKLDNGVPVVLGGLTTVNGFNEREVFETSAASASAKDIWVVTTPELMYDGTRKLGDFENEADGIMRVSKLQKADIFSITNDKITGTPNVDSAAGLVPAEGGWTAGASADNDFAKLIAIETVGATTFYVYEVL